MCDYKNLKSSILHQLFQELWHQMNFLHSYRLFHFQLLMSEIPGNKQVRWKNCQTILFTLSIVDLGAVSKLNLYSIMNPETMASFLLPSPKIKAAPSWVDPGFLFLFHNLNAASASSAPSSKLSSFISCFWSFSSMCVWGSQLNNLVYGRDFSCVISNVSDFGKVSFMFDPFLLLRLPVIKTGNEGKHKAESGS